MAELLLAGTYSGPPPLIWARLVTSWQFTPVPIVLILLLGGWYLRRVHVLRRAGGQWLRARTAWFFCGLAAYALVTVTFVGVYHQVLFSMRALQVVMLLMIVPQCLAHGLPGTLARDTATPAGRARASRILHAPLTQVVTHPIAGLLILLGVPIAYFSSDWYVASLTNPVANQLTQLLLLAAGFHYFWTRLQRDPVPKLFPQYVTTWLTLSDVVLDAIVPAALLITPVLIAAGYYLGLDRPWGPGIADDEHTGASILWILGDLAGLPFLMLSMRQLMRRDKAEATVVDAELDQLEAEEREAAVADPTRGEPTPGTMRPWWENDPDLAQHFGWKQHRR